MAKMPNIAFLRKVKDQNVYATFGYTERRGGYYGFVGGEKTYKAHLRAGYCNYAGGASLGQRGYVTLTDIGERALSAAQAAP